MPKKTGRRVRKRRRRGEGGTSAPKGSIPREGSQRLRIQSRSFKIEGGVVRTGGRTEGYTQ
jgi:hypothetical protein